ncbi:MAG TPA: ATP-binding protein [Candidatus Dormibacteraeota bacterium]|nr:ATP-binding protein [Candidatus Dormibacteraeota bacterium]
MNAEGDELTPSRVLPTEADRDLYRRTDALLSEIEGERRELADQLNDDPVQALAHVARVLQSLDDASGMSSATAKTIHEMGLITARVSEQLRGLAHQLRPPLLDDVGLGAALRQLADEFSASSGIPTFAQPVEVGGVGFPEADLALFRVAQVALRNTENHAAATRVDIGLRQIGSRIALTVRDDGIGLPTAPASTASGTGFVEMRSRLRSLGGRLEVRSAADKGTIVSAYVPVTRRTGGRASERAYA